MTPALHPFLKGNHTQSIEKLVMRYHGTDIVKLLVKNEGPEPTLSNDRFKMRDWTDIVE